MPNTEKVKQISPEQALNNTIEPLISGTKPIIGSNRAEEVSMNGEPLRSYSIGLEDVDYAVMYHIQHIIKPIVIEDDNILSVPVRYAYPEMFMSAQKDGGLRDKDGKILFPIIILKRDNIIRDQEMGNKLDGNKVHNYQMFEKKYSKKNIYDNFSVLTNRIPVKEYVMLPVPDYITATYSCAVYVNVQQDLNTILEGFNYASKSYWGDRNKNVFYTTIDSFPVTMEMNVGDVRKIYSIFEINVKAHLLPDNIIRNLSSARKTLSKAQITFTTETVS